MNIEGLVATLDRLDLLDLEADRRQDDILDGYEVWEIDWSQAEPGPRRDRGELVPEFDVPASQVRERVVAEANADHWNGKAPPPPLFDADAWYLPIHYWGLEYGIYIREDAVFRIAGGIASRFPPHQRGDDDVVTGSVRLGLAILYLHEAFHHRVESFAIRLEIVERTRRYRPYDDAVYLKQRGTDDQLEEALACAEFFARRSEPSYQRNVTDRVHRAALEFTHWWFPQLPEGYRRALEFEKAADYTAGTNRLYSQVAEATPSPIRDESDWDCAPHIDRVLFSHRSVTYILVPVGTKPIIPWFNRSPKFGSLSSRDLQRTLERQGFVVQPGRGKGSHVRLRKPGCAPITLPAGREALSVGVLQAIKRTLNLRSERDLVKLVAST